jgi:hypothetical protein
VTSKSKAHAAPGSPRPANEPQNPRVMDGAIWREFCASLEAAAGLVMDDGPPASALDRAEGFRYLLHFLSAGTVACVTHDDPDYPVFGRLMDHSMPWGLDNPDCLYLHAAVRGDARYRIRGNLGTANHIDIQVNYGHFANGDIASWGTLSSASRADLETDASGDFELMLSAEPQPGNWLGLAENAEFVMVRQYFNDWANERPADLTIERVAASYPPPPLRSDQIADRIDKLRRWLERGGRLWENMSRGLLAMEPNSLFIHSPSDSDQRAGMAGQAYGMGNFCCAPDEAVVIEFTPPACRHWSVGLANYYWQSIDFAERQSSLNGHQARLDSDCVFRGVIAHSDPGVPNWLDTGGHSRGSLALRYFDSDTTPMPTLHTYKLAELRSRLPVDTATIDAAARSQSLAERRHAVWRRFRR